MDYPFFYGFQFDCLSLHFNLLKRMAEILNEAKKLYNEPMHTCEHILNQTMVRMFGCGRSMNAHIEKKQSITIVHCS